MKKIIKCCFCKTEIKKKDLIALNQKLFSKDTKDYYCLPCMAQYFEVTEEDLLNKIEAFKEDGCELFK